MASLNDIANVDISLNTSTVGKASFGIPLVVSPTTAFTDRLRKYSSYSAAVSDKLDAQTLLALSAIFSQTPRPKIAYVGRRNVASFNVTISDSTVIAGDVYSLVVNGETITYTAVEDDDVEKVLNGLNSLIQADATLKALFTNPVVSDSTLSLPKTDPNQEISISGSWNGITKVTMLAGTSNLASDMEAIKAADNTWYGWSLVERNDSLISQGAEWTETQSKLFFARTATPSVWSSATDDVASQLKSKQYLRTVLIADRNAATQYPDAAVMGRFFTKDPGATVFALKSLSSMTPSAFSDTEKGHLIDKNVNTYEQYSDNTYLLGVGTELKASGRVVSGEWIDVVRDRDWLIDSIQKSIASVLIRNNKVPYTNAGIALIVNTLRARLQNAQTQGVIAPDEVDSDGNTVPGFKISYPNAADVDADIKASRILYITFDALLAGAIQLVQITGTLSYSYEG